MFHEGVLSCTRLLRWMPEACLSVLYFLSNIQLTARGECVRKSYRVAVSDWKMKSIHCLGALCLLLETQITVAAP